MYGWIETGIGVDQLFTNTKMMDIVFRTSRTDNVLVLGNGSNTVAGLYIGNNSVGIKKLPNSNYSLDVAGTMCVEDEIVFLNRQDPNGRIVLNNTNIELSRRNEQNVYFDTFGLFKGKVVMSDDVKSRKIILKNFIFQSIYNMQYMNADNQVIDGYRAEVDIGYAEYIENEDVICVNNRLYQVINAFPFEDTGILAIEFDYYLPEQRLTPLNFTTNVPYTVEVLIDIVKTMVNNEYIYLPIFCSSFYYESTTRLHMNIQLLDIKNIDFLQQRAFYHIKNSKTKLAMKKAVSNIIMLESFYFLDEVNIHCTFRSVDGMSPIEPMLGNLFDNFSPTTALPLYLFRLDTVPPKTITETEVFWGFFTNTDNKRYLTLKNTNLIDNVNVKELETKVIDNIILNDGLNFEVTSSFRQDGNVILNIPGLEYYSDYLFAEKGKARYSYVSNPVGIESATYVDDYTVEYVVTNYEGFLNDLLRFVDSYIYVIDKERKIWRLTKLVVTSVGSYMQLTSTGSTAFSIDDAYLLQPRTIYILPFKLQALTLLGDSENNCYIANSLGVGTNIIAEKLTVNGNIALKNQIRLQDDASAEFFYQKYQNNTLSLNNYLYLNDEYALFARDTYIDGAVTANDFMTVSDRRLKRDIRSSPPMHDLDRLLKLNIKEFKFIDRSAYATSLKKGVIAQEVQEILPHIVNNNTGFIPNVYKNGIINKHKQLVVLGDFTQIFAKNSIVKVRKGKNVYECRIFTSTYYPNKHKTKAIISNANVIETGKIFVYGTKGTYKTIDKDYLFMMTINSVKAIYNELMGIKQVLGLNTKEKNKQYK